MLLNRLIPVTLTGVVCIHATTMACPPSSLVAGTRTLAMNKAEARQLVLAEFVGAAANSTVSVFRVVETLDTSDSTTPIGELLQITGRPTRYQAGHRYILRQDKADSFWSLLVTANEHTWAYVSRVPEPAENVNDELSRLRFFLGYLAHDDPVIAEDVFAEFDLATPVQLASLRPSLPAPTLRKLIADPATTHERRPLFCMMLSLCSDPSDVRILKAQLPTIDVDIYPELHRLYIGYVLLTGPDGFDELARANVAATTVDRNGIVHRVPFIQTYAMLRAIRYLWISPASRISKAKLLRAAYILLERPDFSDLAVTQLTRWGDWSQTTRMMALFHEDQQQKSTQRAIVKYFQTLTEDPHAAPGLVQTAAQNLKQLRQQSPAIYRQAMMFRKRTSDGR